jgi:hypothetical protein
MDLYMGELLWVWLKARAGKSDGDVNGLRAVPRR